MLKKFVIVFSLFYFVSLEASAVSKKPLTIWIRSFGITSEAIIVPYLEELENELSPFFDLTLLVATNINDPVAACLQKALTPHKIVYTNLHSISTGLNSLVEATGKDATVLSLSQGVAITASHVIHALGWIEIGALAHGWRISNMNNDGSLPGLGWYNTAALYSPFCLNWMKENPFPYWIDNGVEGTFCINGKEVAIGDNEEVVLMARVINQYPSAYFVHNIRDSLTLYLETAVGISFEEKLKRKTLASNYYLENKLHMNPDEVWSHLWILSSTGLNCFR